MLTWSERELSSATTVHDSDGVATIRLERPPMNAINSAMQEQLRGRRTQVSADESCAPS